MLATVSLNQPLHPEVRPYMLLKSKELNQESMTCSAPLINHRSPMSKHFPITSNWNQYNQALINDNSLPIWTNEVALAERKQSGQGKRGRPHRFSNIAITTATMVKRVYFMLLRALKGFIDSLFKLASILLF